MKIRTRIMLAFFLIIALGFGFLVNWLIDDLRPRYLATLEDAMIDTANVLAAQLHTSADKTIDTSVLEQMFKRAKARSFEAQIYEVKKTRLDLDVYVVGLDGKVIYDSTGKDVGKDYSRWNDVIRTFRGDYGARATQAIPGEPRTTTLHVAAPIKVGDEIGGVLTVSKTVANVNLFLNTAKQRVLYGAVLAAVLAILLTALVSLFITRPLERLKQFALQVRDGKRAALPQLGSSEVAALGQTIKEMRVALEGKDYIEHYVQTLTHEMKSPLSAIRGAHELLQEDMPAEDRERFLENIRTEVQRIEKFIDRMLQLSAIEKRQVLENVESTNTKELLETVLAAHEIQITQAKLSIKLESIADLDVSCERFLLQQALSNLLLNAIDFSPEGSTLRWQVEEEDKQVIFHLTDDGPGIPDYAMDRVFERFYSLQRPATGKKSSGLGLPFVRQVAELHGGTATVCNRETGGLIASISIPRG
jgi:two-component system sensor histidine kinase CreC